VPKSMLDFGSGPGTAVWAACSVWTGQIKRVLAVEPSSGMTDAAKKMLEGLPVRWQRYLFEGNTENLKYDLVTASYVLSELASSKARRQVVRALWKSVEPGGLLVLVDAGTPLAFRYLKELRAMLLQDSKNEEATKTAQGKPVLVAPCPHSHACPMGANSWCHFVQRVERTPLQLAAKPNSSQSFEDEKFTYFVFQKEPLNQPMPDTVGEYYDEENPIFQKGWSRMVRHPLKRGGRIR
jgi:ribosomal protein RSM22 (predicted rRNA methylase)